ncbi:MAG: DUF1587 domain-containing protein, partial [Acidobacteria bacterium]|nr:DUF1587 domain-containing protein [Acidobacteriota bacterium]
MKAIRPVMNSRTLRRLLFAPRRRRAVLIGGLLIVIAGAMAATMSASGHVQAPGPSQSASGVSAGRPSVSGSHRAVLDQYCVTCHNAPRRTAGLALDTLDLERVGESAATWEKVVQKLRAGAMPPVGRPRPDRATSEALVSWLETALDEAGMAVVNPGPPSTFHRLSRTEYKNAVRDLLALENLPREMEVALLLPADSSSSGFDNVSELLLVSPTLLERYLAAAQKISRLAVGDPEIPVLVDTYRFPQELPQDVHVDGLPVGTRGGTVFRHHVPLDGEYLVSVELAGRAVEPHQIEVSVDGARVELLTVGNTAPAGARPAAAGEAKDGLKVRLQLKAGPRQVGVAFVQ